jgi:membrane-bound lytic murein transglycosylase D
MKKLLISCGVMLCLSVGSLQAANDHNPPLKEKGVLNIEKNFSDNLDSIYKSWAIKQSLAGEDTYYNDADSMIIAAQDSVFIPTFPDSVYIDRLSRIETPISLTYNKIVRNFIHSYTNRHRKKVELMLGLSDYYFPMVEEILDKKGMPLELKYLPVIESALNPRAVSRVGATGLWQFMYGTGRMYKLNISSYVDERRDPIKSSYAAVEFMEDLYEMYGDWILVIAAYNCGPGNVRKAIKRAGGKRNYWDIYHYLPRETRGYVPAFIAAMYTFNYYKEHNISPVKIDFSAVTDTLMINKKVHFRQISSVLGVSLQEIRDLNPQYRRDVIPAQYKERSLRLPLQYTVQYIENEDSIVNYKKNVYFSNEFTQVSPKSRSRFLNDPPPGHVMIRYTVKKGDYLGYISEWFNVRTSSLRSWNRIRGSMIREGQKLRIYVPKRKASYYKKFNTMTMAQKQRASNSKSSIAMANTKTVKGGVYYTVKKGDTLWEIAQLYPGVSIASIQRINKLGNGRNIKPGQRIRIK